MWEKKLNGSGVYDLNFIGEKSYLSLQLEDVYKEINRLMDFYRYSLHQGRKQVGKILVNGDHPMLPQIKEKLDGRFDIPLEMISYSEYEQFEQDFSYKYYLALGLALKGV